MDDETRFWIAQQIAETKNTADITPLFAKGKEIAGTRSNTLISDGAPNFHTTYNKKLYTNKWPRTNISITKDCKATIITTRWRG
jgi:putative transposase